MPNCFTDPLVPKSSKGFLGEEHQEAVDPRSLEQTPWNARWKGFQSGALEGLRRHLNPLDIAGDLSLGFGAAPMAGAMRGASGAIGGLTKAAPAAAKLGGVARVGQNLAEFAPQGGEAAYNAARGGAKLADPAWAAYERILKNLPRPR